MAFTEDKSVFFNPLEHGVTALYNGAVTLNGILEDEYAEVFQGEVPVSSQRKAFRYDPADITSPATGTTLVAESVSYIVRDIQLNNGLNRLILESAGVVVPPPVLTGSFSNDFSADFD